MLIFPTAVPSRQILSLPLFLVSSPGVWLILSMCQVPLLLLPHLPTGFTGSSSENTEPCPSEHLCGASASASSVLADPGEAVGPHWCLPGNLRVTKLSFIDLAGSERAWDTPARGEGLWEGTSINRSLLALGSADRALAGAKVRTLPALRLSGAGPGACPRAWSRAEPLGTGRTGPCSAPGQQTDAAAP